MMFSGDKKAIDDFGKFLVDYENKLSEEEDDILYNSSIYHLKLKKLENKKCKNIDDIIKLFKKINKLNKKIRKNKKYSKTKSLSIASYLNDKRYKKKFLDKKKYRKHIKKIAKAEKKERVDMMKMGYLKKNNDPDKLLYSLKLNDANKKMLTALSDSYIQKHFI